MQWVNLITAGGVLAGLLLLALVVGPLATYYLWNWIVVEVLGGPALTFWQAMGTFFLCRVLFASDTVRKSSS